MLTTRGTQTLATWLSQLMLLAFLFIVDVGVIPVSGFNLEPQSAQIFSDPTRNQEYWGRESYFGFSVAIQHNPSGESWLVVGAPRANFSSYFPERITEPGAIFKCSLSGAGDSCLELPVDPTGNTQTSGSPNIDYKNHGWLGAVLDSQPNSEDDRQAIGTCAPRWANQAYVNEYQMNGACYWLNSSLPVVAAHKMVPLSESSEQIFTIGTFGLYFYRYGQAGLSLHFPDDLTEMIIGAPGVFNWQGTVIRYKDQTSPPSQRRRRQVTQHTKSERQMFAKKLIPNPYYTPTIVDFDLNGYSVTSGHFFNKGQLFYASGSPRGSSGLGKVSIFSFPAHEFRSFDPLAEWNGRQLGEFFGGSLVSADVNGDGHSDLVVGAPMYSVDNKPDVGRIQTFLSTKAGDMVPSSSYYGANSALARFGTTLASPGDMNHDSYEDVVVGAPWENDGKGAVYIYMGSEVGLRELYAQRLSPKDFPLHNLKGLGMAFSRGIDIDGNKYPDLAIGSFLSGHAVVLKSRAVASLKAELISYPSTIPNVEKTSITLEACMTYSGLHVPKQVDINGTIYLDYGHPSPRAYFKDSRRAVRKLQTMGTKGKRRCVPFDVDVEHDKAEGRRPIMVKMVYSLLEDSEKLLELPKTDPSEANSTALLISIVTGCEGNGDLICQVDLHVRASLVGYSAKDNFVIGSGKRPVMKVEVSNMEEPAFLPNVTINVLKPFALFLPTSHICDFPLKDSRSVLVCQLSNPIGKDETDELLVSVDTSKVSDSSSELEIDVKVAGEGLELEPKDNFKSQKLQLVAQAELKLHGFSREEELIYQRTDVDIINTTLADAAFTHHYSVVKSGPTPLDRVELVIDIPVNFTDDVNFIKVYAPETNFQDQPFLCNIEGIAYSVERKDNGDSGDEVNPLEMDNELGGVPAPREVKEVTELLPEGSTESGLRFNDTSQYQVQYFSCSRNGRASCARLHCRINSWPAGGTATVSIRMEVNFAHMARHISAQGGATIRTTATASIISLHPNVTFIGVKETTLATETRFLPSSLPSRSVAWWIILLAVLFGLLLLLLLAFILYKLGFFKRKQRDEIKEHKAQLASAGHYGATE